MVRRSFRVSSFLTLCQRSLGVCFVFGRALWSPVCRDRKEDSTTRVHRERRSHGQEKPERVKEIADQKKKAPQLQLCVVAAACTRGDPWLCCPGGGLPACAESLPGLGKGEGSPGGSVPEWDLCPQRYCRGRGAALKSEPVGEVPAGLGALPGAINRRGTKGAAKSTGKMGMCWGRAKAGAGSPQRWAAREAENASFPCSGQFRGLETAVVTQNKVSQTIFCSVEGGEVLMQSLEKKCLGCAKH